MKLEKREDGYYISYYLDRGKVSGESNVKQDQAGKNSSGTYHNQLYNR